MIHPRDLGLLFERYDECFFAGRLQAALEGQRMKFRLSQRMTRSAGTTTRFKPQGGEVVHEIAIAASLLFEAYGVKEREIRVCGLECSTRLDALQRVFEHELVHLTEHLCWESSDRGAARFQGIASRMFLHRSHRYELITWRERARSAGILVGSRVVFGFEGNEMRGRVNRVTKRATVIVEDASGVLYSDGRRYKKYYVPLRMLALERTATV